MRRHLTHEHEAHWHAYTGDVAKILHYDISIANILLADKGSGILIDWESTKKDGEGREQQSDRVGTWRFMFANLLPHAKEMPTLADDLESFLRALGWTTPTSPPRLRPLSYTLFKTKERLGRNGQARPLGVQGIVRHSHSSFTPFSDLLKKLNSPFGSRYPLGEALRQRCEALKQANPDNDPD